MLILEPFDPDTTIDLKLLNSEVISYYLDNPTHIDKQRLTRQGLLRRTSSSVTSVVQNSVHFVFEGLTQGITRRGLQIIIVGSATR